MLRCDLDSRLHECLDVRMRQQPTLSISSRRFAKDYRSGLRISVAVVTYLTPRIYEIRPLSRCATDEPVGRGSHQTGCVWKLTTKSRTPFLQTTVLSETRPDARDAVAEEAITRAGQKSNLHYWKALFAGGARVASRAWNIRRCSRV